MAGSRWGSATVVGLVMGLALAGCGTESEASNGATVDDPAVGAWLSRTSNEAVSPVLEFILDGDLGKMNRLLVDRDRQQQDVTKRCMNDQGFEWVVVDTVPDSGVGRQQWGGLTRAEFVERWGYGVSTSLGADGQPLVDVPGTVPPDTSTTTVPDANAAFAAGLPPERQLEYAVALNGVEGGPGGCLQQGWAVTFESPPPAVVEQFSAMNESIELRLDAAPATIAALDQYGGCMEEAGFGNVGTPDDAKTLIERRLAEEVWITNAATGERFLNAEALEKLQRFELTLAAAELPCLADYELSREQARGDIERLAMKEHPDLVEQVRIFYASFDV